MKNVNIIENLGFTGGSVKGTAYVGVAKALYDTNLIDDVKRVSGVSAGSIFATLLALDFSPEEMRDIMLDMDFNKFEDGSFGNVGNIYRLATNQGMHSGEYFYNWMQDLIEKKSGNKNLTFADLHQQNDKYLDLYVVSANLNTQILDIFSYETTPNVKIVDAIRCSMSIPFFFTPYKVNGFSYSDGGIIDNYPIELFDKINYEKVKSENYKEGDYHHNSATLGFALTDPISINSYKYDKPEKIMNTDSGIEVFKAIMNLLLNGAQYKELHQESHRTVYISNLGVGMLDFDLSKESKQALMKEGYKSTMAYIAAHNFIENQTELSEASLSAWVDDYNIKSIFDKMIACNNLSELGTIGSYYTESI